MTIEEKFILPLKSEIKQVLRIEAEAIPSFSPVMTKMLALSIDEDASIEDLCKLVKTDPGISAKVLGIVNSAMYSLRRKITVVSEAVIHLGVDEVKKIALGVAVFEKMVKPGAKRHFDRIFFWRHCLCVAVLSKAIAQETGYPAPEEAYICGLLHDLGKIVFDLYGCVDYDDFIANVAKYTGTMITEERGIMGMGHDDVGAYYCALWQLPDPLSLVLKFHHQRYDHLDFSQNEARLIAIVSLANFLAWTQGMGSVDIIRPPILQPEVGKNINLDDIDFTGVISCMDREMESTSQFYNFVFPSAGQFRENLFKANLELSSINTMYHYRGNRQAAAVDMSKITRSIITPHRSLDPKAIISATLRAVYEDFPCDRVYIMKVVKTLRSLKVIECFDTSGTCSDLKSIEIPMNKNAGGFINCLRDKKPVIITGRTSGEKQALGVFKIKTMVIVPFCSDNKVIGILGMDNIVSRNPFLPDTLSAIAMVAAELGMAMENAGVYKEAKAASYKDGLTGLLNRLAIDELLAGSFRKAVEGKHALSLVMIDVDYFKKFNDTFGHQTGDNVLKLIATTLKKLSRPFDHVGRYGGEEFIVVLNNTDLSEALVYAERIRLEIQQLGRLLASRFPGLFLTVSAGVTEYTKTIKNRDALIAQADKALYKAKETGRNRVAPF
jgi:two-component system, cell cycle response regulator